MLLTRLGTAAALVLGATGVGVGVTVAHPGHTPGVESLSELTTPAGEVSDDQPHLRPVASAAPSTTAPAPLPPPPTTQAPAPPPTPVAAPVRTKAAPAPVAPQAPKVAAAPAYVPPTYGVAMTTVDEDDTSRGRDLPTAVYQPTTAGRYPLIVFAHGYCSSPAVYDILLRAWASAGYVVAAPTFPVTNSSVCGDENDMVNEPADMSFVMTQLSSSMAGVLDLSHGIGVAGHSDGGIVALAIGYANKYRDSRVTAVGVYEGSAYSQEFGSYSANSAPLMVAQSDSDEYNSESDGQSAYAVDAGGTRDFLQLYGAKHLPPYSQQTAWTPPVERATTAWFDLYLAHRTSDTSYPVTAGTVSGVSKVTRG